MQNDGPPFGAFLPGGAAAPEGLEARAGQPRGANAPPIPGEETVVEALRGVYDPEIPVNIYDLGLIYELDIDEDGSVRIAMTLTAPACPVAGEMPQQVADAVAAVPGTGEISVTLTWDPPWTPAHMSEDARLALGL